ncbi:CxxH/CxxC protein [Proteinivorax hydrogeniformans]|uniref:CxxH/CxxC protein n=1 Tax=Proteinivorax hydrogeniformans TaxID=1826727 RepID=A0AAU8HT06_9FIRM
MYVVCKDHLYEAIDDFVDVYEMPPDLYRLGEVTFTDWAQPSYCDMCSNPPVYLVV